MLSYTGIDPFNPQSTEIPLFDFAVTIAVLQTLFYTANGSTIGAVGTSTITLGHSDDALVFLRGKCSSLKVAAMGCTSGEYGNVSRKGVLQRCNRSRRLVRDDSMVLKKRHITVVSEAAHGTNRHLDIDGRLYHVTISYSFWQRRNQAVATDIANTSTNAIGSECGLGVSGGDR